MNTKNGSRTFNFSILQTFSTPTDPQVRQLLLGGFFAALLIGSCLPTISVAQNLFEEGRQWYQQRAAEADSFRASPNYINNAIQAFEEAMEQGVQPEASAEYLLRSYYFKGMYVGLSGDEQRQVYDKGRELGERMIEQFPKSVPIKFWYGANTGRWADVHGFMAAATSGIAKKLRNISQDIIELDSTYQGGGGYRILAQVHYHTPNIPLVMGWPSDEKALELVEKAIEIVPQHSTNLLLHAQLLLEFNRSDEARTQLETLLNLDPRPDYLVEDRYVQHRAQQLLEEAL